MRMLYTFVLLSFSLLGSAQSDLELQLFELPDVIFKKIATPKGFEAAYELKIKQPIDHKDPTKGSFYQRVYLSHKDFAAPTAIITNGYGRPSNRITEVATLAGANQINVEHRYFLESCPDTLDYDYLNFEQVTADLHNITTLFKKLYSGKWISTGISKGGTTTIFYRYFYPDDVDVSIPYVAPVNHSAEDKRIYEFFDKVGDDACRKSLYNYQVKMLEEAELMKSYLKWFAKGQGLKFSYLNLDQAYEYAILEYPFSVWQWGTDCNTIPQPSAPVDTLIQHFVDVVGLEFYSDASMTNYASHYFQSAEEMGYYGFEVEDFKSLLKHVGQNGNPSAIFTPDNMEVKFDGTLTNKVFEWTQKTDLPFIYINGANDTWSATAVPEVKRSESLWFFMKDKSHGDARIKNMSNTNKQKIERKLSKWLEQDVDLSVLGDLANDGSGPSAATISEKVASFLSGTDRHTQFILSDLEFRTASAIIKKETASEIDELATILKDNSGLIAYVQAYTDNTGDAAANIQLTLARANAIKALLMEKGVAAPRIGTKGHGGAKPIADNSSAEGRAQNRRVEVVISR